jgi:SAM-dependent methyltransferase
MAAICQVGECAMRSYTKEFYQSQRAGSRRSAEAIVPLVLALVKPWSVIDVGCGLGTWLSIFEEFGVKDVFGIDGDHVDRSMLQISPERFAAFDLRKPIQIDRRFDLVVSLEVAEHLPKDCAKTFVDSLTKLGPVILFSAAIPFQGGTSHLNEQWPDYWANYFNENGYEAVDCFRKKVWQDDNVEWWYAQNILLFSKKDYLASNPLLKEEFENTHPSQLSIVHPRKYLELVRIQLTGQDLANLIPKEDKFIFVDQEQLRELMALGDQAIPFPERSGQYWGPPADDETAIRELTRLRESGAKFLVFAWPAFWWLEYYTDFHRNVCSRYRCVLKNERLVVFDLEVNRKSPIAERPPYYDLHNEKNKKHR